jgi:hypothetical protein
MKFRTRQDAWADAARATPGPRSRPRTAVDYPCLNLPVRLSG